VVGVANPKLAVFFVAILPQFADADGAPVGIQMAVLGVVFVFIALVCDSAWGLGAGTARNWLARSPRHLERFGALGGVVIVALGLRLAATGRGH
jgi:threonine/homoserine/homoserine lactone efflux protein